MISRAQAEEQGLRVASTLYLQRQIASMMCLLFPIPNSSLPDKQDGLTRTWVIEPGKKPLMSSLTPPATTHVLTAMRAVQKCLGLLNGRRLCRLDGLPLCQARPSRRRKLKPKHLPISDRFNQQAIGMKQNRLQKMRTRYVILLGETL